MAERQSNAEQGSTDPTVRDGVRNDGTTPSTATGGTGAHARPVTTDDRVHGDRVQGDRVRDDRVRDEHVVPETAHEKYGGVNTGAAFFGWLVAVAITILLTGIIGAVAAAVSDQTNVTQNDAERAANTIGLVAAIVLVAVLALAYYTGGYVAGRMSRFDGARQGLGVWLIGLVITLIAVAVGWIFGDQYNVLDRVDLPRIPIPTDQVSSGGVITGLVVVVVTALAAMAGGTVGRRYHVKVDRHLAA
jgi:amino acid transporter